MVNDEAVERIQDLEEQLADMYIVNDLLQEEMYEIKAENRRLKQAIANWKHERRFHVA